MTRAELHELLDILPDDRLDEARGRLAELVEDPVLHALMLAPVDDEPVTPVQAATLDRRRHSAARGRTISTDELMSRLNL